MLDPRITSLAEVIVNYSCEVKPGDKVIIEAIDVPHAFTNELIRLTHEAGGIPLVKLDSNIVKRSMLHYGSVEGWNILAKAEQDLMSQAQCYIGEFAIAFNPYCTKPLKDILFDEKMAGSLHLTPGNCYEQTENGNRSSVHWDLVLLQTPEKGGGEILFDGTLIRKDGRFVVEDLKGLNPENLK